MNSLDHGWKVSERLSNSGASQWLPSRQGKGRQWHQSSVEGATYLEAVLFGVVFLEQASWPLSKRLRVWHSKKLGTEQKWEVRARSSGCYRLSTWTPSRELNQFPQSPPRKSAAQWRLFPDRMAENSQVETAKDARYSRKSHYYIVPIIPKKSFPLPPIRLVIPTFPFSAACEYFKRTSVDT